MLELIANNLLYASVAGNATSGSRRWREGVLGLTMNGNSVIFDTRLADCRCGQRDLWHKLVENALKNEVINLAETFQLNGLAGLAL